MQEFDIKQEFMPKEGQLHCYDTGRYLRGLQCTVDIPEGVAINRQFCFSSDIENANLYDYHLSLNYYGDHMRKDIRFLGMDYTETIVKSISSHPKSGLTLEPNTIFHHWLSPCATDEYISGIRRLVVDVNVYAEGSLFLLLKTAPSNEDSCTIPYTFYTNMEMGNISRGDTVPSSIFLSFKDKETNELCIPKNEHKLTLNGHELVGKKSKHSLWYDSQEISKLTTVGRKKPYELRYHGDYDSTRYTLNISLCHPSNLYISKDRIYEDGFRC